MKLPNASSLNPLTYGVFFWASSENSRDGIEEKNSHSFSTVLLKAVDFEDFRSLFIKVHSFGHSVFGRRLRDF